MLRHILAPVVPRAAGTLRLQRTLGPGAPTAVALTFDDGPHPEGTPRILEILDQAQAKATFFVIGEQVQRRPELAARIVARGHAIALHGHRHVLQLRLTEQQLNADLTRGARVIEEATGREPVWHRPPYGIYSPKGLLAARERGLRPLLWSRWGKDWRKFTTPQRIARRITAGIAPGDVILLHDADFYSAKNSHCRTAQALELIVTELKLRKLGTVLPV
jgi:peptidoglycan-N-acetylglucosamine deacetylase